MHDVISIIDERAVDPHLAQANLDRLTSRAREGLIGAACALAAGAALAARRPVRHRGAGRRSERSPASSSACTPAAIAGHSCCGLVSQRSCYDIPDVERAAARMATSDLRRTLVALAHPARARDLRPRAAEPAAARCSTERVEEHTDEILSIAYLLAREGVRIHPAALALCGRMVDSVARSPLYNPRVPEQHLRIALQRIRSSISRLAPAA